MEVPKLELCYYVLLAKEAVQSRCCFVKEIRCKGRGHTTPVRGQWVLFSDSTLDDLSRLTCVLA